MGLAEVTLAAAGAATLNAASSASALTTRTDVLLISPSPAARARGAGGDRFVLRRATAEPPADPSGRWPVLVSSLKPVRCGALRWRWVPQVTYRHARPPVPSSRH